MSTGERLLPYFYAALEICWIDELLIGLASLHFLGYGVPLVPLWVPFVPLAFSCWMARQYKQYMPRSFRSNPLPTIALNSLVIFFLAWITLLVAQRLDPEVLYDFPLFGPSILQVLVSITFVFLLCWRGYVFAQRNADPRHIVHTLGWGASIALLVIFVEGMSVTGGGVSSDAFPLLLLIVFFVCLSLMAHTLSHLIYIRRYHSVGLQGSIVRQERATIRIVAVLCFIFLLVTMFVGSLISPTLIDIVKQPLGLTLDWLVTGLGQILSLILEPIGWLLNTLHIPFSNMSTHGGFVAPDSAPPPLGHGKLLHLPYEPALHVHKHPSSSSNSFDLFQWIIIHYILPLLLIGLIVILIINIVSRLRQRKQPEEDVRESLWSWTLFWAHIITFLQALFAFFLPKYRVKSTASTVLSEQKITVAPTTRSIRAIYQALLNYAAKSGYPRQQDETPHEFQIRLCKHFPLAEQHLAIITDAYMWTRYGGNVPAEGEVMYIRDMWKELEHKWHHF